MKKIIIALFFVISYNIFLNGQSDTPLITEETYTLKNIPSPQDIAWDGNNFWVIDNFTFNLYKLSSDFESIDTSIYLNPRDFRDLAFDGQYFWVVDNTFHQVLKINKDSLNVIKVISLPVEKFITGITCDSTDIYLSWEDGWSSQIAKVVPGTDSVSPFIAYTMGAVVTGLTYYDSSFYYCSIDKTPRIVAVKPHVFPPILFSLPGEIKSPTDVEIVSGSFWVLDFENRKLYKLREDSTSSSVTEPIIPNEEILLQNYPNPFNPNTTINFSLPQRSFVTITIFDALGRKVATLVNDEQEAGIHKVKFDGSLFSSGVYIYRIKASDFISSKKLILLK